MSSTTHKTLKLLLFFLTSLVISLVALPCVLILALFSPQNLCGQTLIKEKVSPDGEFKAVAFFTDCGATTPYTANVSVLKASEELPDGKGNVFRGKYGVPYVDVYWAADTELIIVHRAHLDECIHHEKNWQGKYEQTPYHITPEAEPSPSVAMRASKDPTDTREWRIRFTMKTKMIGVSANNEDSVFSASAVKRKHL